jgi:hypothetical protein
MDAVVKRKIPSPRRESNPRTPIAVKLKMPSAENHALMANRDVQVMFTFYAFQTSAQHSNVNDTEIGCEIPNW